MSFLKITDPAKRDFIVGEYLKRKKNIQDSFRAEKLGDISLQRDLTKFYKPITESALTKELNAIKENSLATSEALKALPAALSSQWKAIQFPQYPSIEAYDDPVEDIRTLMLGEMATKYLREYTSSKAKTDTIFGIHSKDGNFYIGNTPVTIEGDDIVIGDKTYKGTIGLWELLTMKEPNENLHDLNDRAKYAEILKQTSAISQASNPESSRSKKYLTIIKPIWDSIKPSPKGKGISSIVIPQDPNALAEMLALRLASFKAGNTRLRNEIVAISDELLRQGIIDKDYYKKLMLRL